MVTCHFQPSFKAIMRCIGRARRKRLDQAYDELIKARSESRKDALQKGAEAVQKLDQEFSRLLGTQND